ncbi:type II secretion system F family protein [Oceanirhabdus sp. W0125-5]|uniref:type II secretion system F family protein n=1 Tax=Oceanirhabdus sp. W0125-5 TaxID=2999116 RepID=UPI0022F2C983|nr:type II secretion system F family protein [Oceanirhabdus sp. W0125-5]WBW95955.1 type II secretion system F family protein [Oceanirhabdus sp. W0125-5]
MLVIVILTAISSYMISISVADLIFGERVRRDYLSSFYENISGIKKNKKNKKRKKKSYVIDKKSYLKYSIASSMIIFIFAILFFRSVGSAILFSLGGFFYPKFMMKKKMEKRKEVLNIQFREALLSISNSLKAGNSLAGALERSLTELKNIYKKQIEKPMIYELELIVYELQIGKSVTEALIRFKERVKLEDVNSFVNAAVITEKTGGNLTEVMGNVSDMISDKIEVKREISTLTAGKRTEAKLLTIMPVCVVLILSMIAPSYMAPMYETVLGKFLMMLGVSFLIINYFIGKRIINISV